MGSPSVALNADGRLELFVYNGTYSYYQLQGLPGSGDGSAPLPGPFRIANQLSGKVLDVTGASTANGALIQQWDWLQGGNQQWQVIPLGNGYAQIMNLSSGKVLDDTNLSTSNGTTIQQYDWVGGDNQQWLFVPTGNGSYAIRNKLSGKVLDVTGYSTANGAAIQQWDWLGGANQQWQINLPSVSPSVSLTNLTHPNLSPTIDYVEQTSNAGSYTQVWSVGNIQATPAVSFVVGQFSTTGTVTTTDVGQTSDGHLEGVSSLSIANGVVSTYSATVLDYTASLYYDSSTVATLFDEGAPVSQTTTPVSISTTASLSANATAWHDYDLQTDHYAIAYFLNGGYYENPLYWGDSCYAETGDCTIDGSGGYAYWITAAAIYMGSTLADQGYVPPDGSLPPFDLNAYNGFVAVSQPAYPSGVIFRDEVTEWIKRITSIYIPAKLLADTFNSNGSANIPPIPLYVELVDDTYDVGTAERQRTFIIKDLYGRPWNMNFPLRVRERFTNVYYSPTADPPVPNGIWFNRVPQTSPND